MKLNCKLGDVAVITSGPLIGALFVCDYLICSYIGHDYASREPINAKNVWADKHRFLACRDSSLESIGPFI